MLIIRTIIYGFLVWLIPFISAFFLYSPEGKLSIDIFLFKSIMLIIGVTTGTILLINYFQRINKFYLRNAIILGLIWLLISLGLDILILVPMAKMTLTEYFYQIGLRYLLIPIYAIGMAILIKQKI